ncbi:cupin domain-containing protein [Burkholderia sp. BCC1999]|uniref:cupin domain-containing protein n=1 Tax=Burkholderia sp. BCC1999 TaxID=2817448 RepID=UPI002AC32A50|nr:cupin domain-containing protein [Burkholderia sp. BCC1999]
MNGKIVTGNIHHANNFKPLTVEEGGWQTLKGNPATQVHDFVNNGTMWCALSTWEACAIRETINNYSSIQVLEGDLTITHGDEVIELTAGGLAFFTPGMEVVFEVKTHMREVFTVLGEFNA